MSSLGTSKGMLEMAKFAAYAAVPIAVICVVAADSSRTLHKFLGFRPSVVYLPEGPRPPSLEELQEMACNKKIH